MNDSSDQNQVVLSGDELGVRQEVNSDKHPTQKESLMKKTKPKSSFSIQAVLLSFVIVLGGIFTGYALRRVVVAKPSSQGGIASSTSKTALDQDMEVEVGVVYGSDQEDSFVDEVEGILLEGGVGGEGSHHLQRPGGVSQNVYLTSSVLDLNLFLGHKIHIWGDTFAAQKAGWLIDVGKVKPVELNAELYFEE